ncbi:MAG: hypothetical protein HFK04_00955 [Oscillospiraceae bacterium]|nr:hypothetical protein [Oscillospiraceae bacterium]
MKKIISVFIACFMILNSFIFVYAETNTDDETIGSTYGGLFPERVPSAQEQFQDFLHSKPSSKDVADVQNKINGIHEPVPSARYGAWIYLPNTFTVIDQGKDYYCAASCVKSTMNYIKGSSESLSATYVNLQGTGQIQPGVCLARIAPYLNQEQNATRYVTRDYKVSYENMRIQLTAAINQYQTPAIIVIKAMDGEWGYYNTAGHALSVIGAYSDQYAFYLGDPLYKIAGCPSKYAKGAGIIYNGISYESGTGYVY